MSQSTDTVNQDEQKPAGISFSAEQQAKLQELIDSAYTRAYKKAESEYKPKITEYEAKLAELSKTQQEQKPVQKKEQVEINLDEEIKKALATQLEPLKKSLQEKENIIKSLKFATVENEVISHASELKAINPKIVSKLVKDYIKENEKGGYDVINDQGMPRINAKGEGMGVKELVSEFLQQNPYLLNSSGNNGAGSNTGNYQTGNNPKFTDEQLQDKNFIRKNCEQILKG